MNLSRRSFFTGLVAAIVAPAVIRTPGLLMPVKSLIVPQGGALDAFSRQRIDALTRLPPGMYEMEIVDSNLDIGGRVLALTFKILDGPNKDQMLMDLKRVVPPLLSVPCVVGDKATYTVARAAT